MASVSQAVVSQAPPSFQQPQPAALAPGVVYINQPPTGGYYDATTVGWADSYGGYGYQQGATPIVAAAPVVAAPTVVAAAPVATAAPQQVQPPEKKKPVVMKKKKASRRCSTCCYIYCGVCTIMLAAVVSVVLVLFVLPPAGEETEEEDDKSTKTLQKSKAAKNRTISPKFPDFSEEIGESSEEQEPDSAADQGSDVPPGWTEWTQGDCSVTCGLGTITRRRTCGGDACESPQEVKESKCYQGACQCSFFVSNNLNIWTVKADGASARKYKTPGKKAAKDLCFDPISNALFWTNGLRQLKRNNEQVKTFGRNIGGLVVDTEQQLIFVAVLGLGVAKTGFEGSSVEYIRNDRTLTICDSLVNLPLLGLLFWANDARRMIETVSYDGKGHKIMYTYPSMRGAVAGITADPRDKVIYWMHRKDAVIYSIPHDGKNNPKIVFPGVKSYVGEDLVMCLGNLYYIDPNTGGGTVWKIGTKGQERERVNNGGIPKCDSLYLDN